MGEFFAVYVGLYGGTGEIERESRTRQERTLLQDTRVGKGRLKVVYDCEEEYNN